GPHRGFKRGMRQKLSNGLYWLTGVALTNGLFNLTVATFWNGYPKSSLEYYLDCVIYLLVSLLLFYLIWRAPRRERWTLQMSMLTLLSSFLAGSYIGWLYAPTWSLPPLLGHVLGLLGGASLGGGIVLWELQAITARKRRLQAERQPLEVQL